MEGVIAAVGGHGSHGGDGSPDQARGQRRGARPRSGGCGSESPNEQTKTADTTDAAERETPAAGGHQHG